MLVGFGQQRVFFQLEKTMRQALQAHMSPRVSWCSRVPNFTPFYPSSRFDIAGYFEAEKVVFKNIAWCENYHGT